MTWHKEIITMAVGGGGKTTNDFISRVIREHLGNPVLNQFGDAAYIDLSEKAAFTTDSFVVKPEFFTGGNIGKLAVCGTVNDLAVSGAEPKYLSLGLVVPEGYSVEKLTEILASIGKTAREAGVVVACGDTKVVERGALDSVILNTAGVGVVRHIWNDAKTVKAGDKVIITSDIARHGVSILLARGDLGFDGEIESDCACLNGMLAELHGLDVHFCRDATRGGVAAVLNEIAPHAGVGFRLMEADIPVREDVRAMCETIGFDPLSVANEGVAVILVSAEDADEAVARLRRHETGKSAVIAGVVTEDSYVTMETVVGGIRVVDMPPGELLPRIC